MNDSLSFGVPTVTVSPPTWEGQEPLERHVGHDRTVRSIVINVDRESIPRRGTAHVLSPGYVLNDYDESSVPWALSSSILIARVAGA